MSFSAEWLSLREPVDHRSRSKALLARVAAHLAPLDEPSIVDIGCGTGSNLRATAPALGRSQRWVLVDYDPGCSRPQPMLSSRWAGQAISDDAGLVLMRGRADDPVTFRQADLAADLDARSAGDVDLVTASAFFDLARRRSSRGSPAAVPRCARHSTPC